MPFCIDRMGSESTKRKMNFNIEKVAFHCWRCEYGKSNLERFFRDLNGGVLRIVEAALIRGEIRPPKAKNLVAQIAKMIYVDEKVKALRSVKLPPEMESLTQCQWDDPPLRLKRAIRYLKERGTGPASVHKFKIGYCPTGRYAQRLVFPVFQGGKQIYFTTRFAGKHYTKALNAQKQDGYHGRSTCLLNYDGVVGAKVVAVVEGAFDLMAHQHAVGLIGKEISDTHIDLLLALAKLGTEEFVISLDAGAGKSADKVRSKLAGYGPKVTMLVLKRGDPHDNRAKLPALMAQRSSPNLRDRIRQRFTKD